MMIIFLVLMIFQSAIDSTLNKSDPYQGLNYTISEGDYLSSFDPSSGKIYLFEKSSRILISISEESIVDTLGTISQRFEGLDKMDITRNGKSIYFWENGIGRVHRYDINTGTMVREDTSHSHRTMFNHASFLSEENYIYAIGGYGYWEMRNFLIRYEPEFGEWEKIPSLNDDIIIRSSGGLLYKIGNDFYYFVDDKENNDPGKSHAYKFNIENKLWSTEHDLERVFENFIISSRSSAKTFHRNTTYKVDPNNRHLGFISIFSEFRTLNFVSVDESVIYLLDLRAYGIYDVRDVFYSERIKQWVIIGHEYQSDQRLNLRAYLFNFDENHPLITVISPDHGFLNQTITLSAVVVTGFGILAIMLFFFTRGKENDSNDSVLVDSTKKPVHILKGCDDSLSVFINGNRFKISEDNTLKELWTIIAEQVESGDSSILVSNIDQRLYPSQSHASYNSRNRKKLVKIINSACGFNLISEERSKIDKRYKVLTIQTDKISIRYD